VSQPTKLKMLVGCSNRTRSARLVAYAVLQNNIYYTFESTTWIGKELNFGKENFI
jgi:hypothetical protein